MRGIITPGIAIAGSQSCFYFSGLIKGFSGFLNLAKSRCKTVEPWTCHTEGIKFADNIKIQE